MTGRGYLVFACLVFLLTRLFTFLVTTEAGDVRIYAAYARTYQATSLEGLYASRTIEYPPLAVVAMIVPQLCARHLSGDPSGATYQWAFRTEMLLFDALTFVIFLRLLRTCCPRESSWRLAERSLVFCLAGAALAPILYDRLDVAMTALVMLSLLLLLSGAHYGWSFLVLALAIAFKLAPVVLAPVWVFASLPGEARAAPRQARAAVRLLLLCLWRCAVLALLVLAVFVPFFLVGGERTLAFFAYHRERGIEFASLYGSVIALLKLGGQPAELYLGHGSTEIRSALSPLFVSLSPLVVGGLLSAATVLAWTRLTRASPRDGEAPRLPGPPSQAYRSDLIAYTSLFLLIFIVGNKVLSPQYLLWLVPLVPLVPLEGAARRLYLWTFIAACLLTSLIYPLWYERYILGRVITRDPLSCEGPTPTGAALLAARSLALIGLLCLLAAYLVKRSRPAPVPGR